MLDNAVSLLPKKGFFLPLFNTQKKCCHKNSKQPRPTTYTIKELGSNGFLALVWGIIKEKILFSLVELGRLIRDPDFVVQESATYFGLGFGLVWGLRVCLDL